MMCHGLVHCMHTHNYVNVLMKLTPPPKIPMFFNQSRKSTAHILVQTPQQQHMASCHCGLRCFIGKGMRRFPLFKRMGTVLATLTVGRAGSLARPRSKWEDTCQSAMGVPHRPGCRPRNHTDSWGRPLHIHHELYKMRLYMS